MSDSVIRQAFEDDGLRYRSSILRYEKDLNLMAMTQEHRSEEFFTIMLSSYYICLFLRFLIGVNVYLSMHERLLMDEVIKMRYKIKRPEKNKMGKA